MIIYCPKSSKAFFVTAGVRDEILAGGQDDKAADQLLKLAWLTIAPSPDVNEQVRACDLGRGETESISLCLDTEGSRILIDDAAGRKCARQLGLNFIGTGGILILAKRVELISSFMTSIEMVRDSGLWISNEIVDVLRKKAGE